MAPEPFTTAFICFGLNNKHFYFALLQNETLGVGVVGGKV